ncbi:MAG: S8 family serine peptidase, partial [Cyclobacteriaceae bacterium]|nr:S8 family serine peptidase [Cyclobacteriaceae bacterium]
AFDWNSDESEMASEAAAGALFLNHSYGYGRGWVLNGSWSWYGNTSISTQEDYLFGFYDSQAQDWDQIAYDAPYYLIVKSAGNDRNQTPSTYEHYVWDETWKLVNVERDSDGGADGFDCLTPMAVAKNILTVGAVDDAKAMTSFSAYGPTDDGRIKPDVVANGSDVFSSTSATDSSYVTYSGTSMSTASVTGSVALLHQLQNTLQPGIKLLSSTIKGLLIHTATDLGNTGPDYRFGWGLLNIKEAADLIYANSHNQGKYIYEAVLANDGEIIIPVTTQSAPFLKVTICWTDPAGQASSASLNSRNIKLVNDLDVLVENSNSLETYLVWILDVENPGGAATRNSNHVDNVEQIYLVNPGDNNFNIKISPSGSLAGGSQIFSLIISGIETTSNIFPPKNLTYTINESSILLNWNPPDSGTPELYKIYRNGNLLAVTENTSFIDQSIVLDNIYEYYVTAEYEFNSEKFESLGTNQISVFPQTLRSLPFLVDFEQETNEILFKNSLDGWQWGDSESLNCYYLDFSDNTTKFIGIDSYSAGDAIHVSDIAITVPLRLANYNNIILSFDYLLKTGIYDAIDELHVVYKLQEENEWHELKKLDKAFDWTYHSFELPPDMCKNGTLIGFYYDDFYQWGMGAGIDNIRLDGTLDIIEDLSLETISSPESIMCLQQNPLNLAYEINNSGNTSILTGEILQVTTSCNGIQKVNNYTLIQNLNP